MNKAVQIGIPDAGTRARQSVVRSLLKSLISHEITMEEAVTSVDRLFVAARMMDQDLLKRANEVVMHGRTITYPSISSAEQVRNLIAELVVAFHGGQPPAPSAP